EEIWYDRVTSSRLRWCVRGRANEQGGVLALEDLSSHSLRIAQFADAAALATTGASIDQSGAMLAHEVANVIGADAVFVFVSTRSPERLMPLATSRQDLTPGLMAAAYAAARTGTPCEIDVIDNPDAMSIATPAMLSAGLRSLVAFPLTIGSEQV